MRSSVKPSNATNGNLIGRTIETWQPRLDSDLSREDARQIIENLTGIFSILAEWARAERPEPANDIKSAVTSDDEARHDR